MGAGEGAVPISLVPLGGPGRCAARRWPRGPSGRPFLWSRATWRTGTSARRRLSGPAPAAMAGWSHDRIRPPCPSAPAHRHRLRSRQLDQLGRTRRAGRNASRRHRGHRRSGLCRRSGEGQGAHGARRVGRHRRGPHRGTPGRRRRLRVPLPRRLDRSRGGGAAGAGRRTGHGGTASPAGRAGLRRHPHAGGHRRLRSDDQGDGGHHRAQGGRTALPRAPAAPDDRWGPRLLGIARSPHVRRAGGPHRFPRAARSRSPVRRAVPVRCPGRREPARSRPRRRGADLR